MNSGQLPKTANFVKMAIQSASVDGSIRPANAARIAHLDVGSDLLVDLQFTLDEQRRRIVSGSIKGKVGSPCQRCLEIAEIDLDLSIKLVLVDSEERAKNLDESLDYWVVEGEDLELALLVEEEVLLAMPTIVYHDDCEMLGYAQPEEEAPIEQEKPNPFSVLAGLKTNNSEDDKG